MRTVKNSHDQVLMEMEVLNDQLKIEQNRVLSLQNELKSGASAQRAVNEVRVWVSKECGKRVALMKRNILIRNVYQLDTFIIFKSRKEISGRFNRSARLYSRDSMFSRRGSSFFAISEPGCTQVLASRCSSRSIASRFSL